MTNQEAKEKIFYQWQDFLEHNIDYAGISEAYKMAIKALEQETGHWEWLTEDKYRCSNCNSETRVDECMNVPLYEFCPFCGARMFEPQESEDAE